MPSKQKRRTSEQSALKKYVTTLGVAVLCGVISTLTLMAIFSFVIIATDLNKTYIPYTSFVAVALSCFISAVVMSSKIRKNGLVSGAVCSAIMFLIFFLVAFAVNKGSVSFNAIYHLVASLLGGVLGGISGVNMKIKR